MRRRVWCETASPEALIAPATIALLERFGIHPILAVWPHTMDAAREAASRYADRGLSPALWPMLSDAEGRWIGAGNAARFLAFAESLEAAELVLDLEPPIESLRSTLASRAVLAHVLPGAQGRAAFVEARQRIAWLAERVHDRGARLAAAVALPVLCDGEAPAWQERLGTPVDGIAWDHVSPMLYTSIIEGWSRGLLARADARAVLAWSCRRTAARFGAVAGASLGAVGTGAFGDEPVYRSPAELADDVAVARAAGIDDLALFDLGGVLRRPPVEAWLEAFVATPPAPSVPSLTPKAALILGGAWLAGRVLGLLPRA
jgi:hypothetical protein